jgi:hypothetical protein
MPEEGGEVTGTRDKDYNIIWFVEQCLSNTLRLDMYVQDAERETTVSWSSSSAGPRTRAARAPSRARACWRSDWASSPAHRTSISRWI